MSVTVTRTVKTTTSAGGSVTVTTTETTASGDEAEKLLKESGVKMPAMPDLSGFFNELGDYFKSIFPGKPKP